MPLSILESWSVDEKSKSAVTKPGLLPSNCADSAKQGKREEVGDYLGANTGTADYLRLLRTGGLHNRNRCNTSATAILCPFPHNTCLHILQKSKRLSWLWPQNLIKV